MPTSLTAQKLLNTQNIIARVAFTCTPKMAVHVGRRTYCLDMRKPTTKIASSTK